MSRFSVRLDYESHLWWEDYDYRKILDVDGITVGISPIGISLSCEYTIKKEDKISLAKSLSETAAPHWQNIPLKQHSTIINIANLIHAASTKVDMALRKIPKCYRLPKPSYGQFYLNQQPHCEVIYWNLDDKDREDLSEVLSNIEDANRIVTSKSIILPFPIYYDRQQIHINEMESKIVEDTILSETNVIPYKQLFSEAYARFTKREYETSVLLLVTAIETGLKSFIGNSAGDLLVFMLDKMASPSLENLYTAAIDYCDLNTPRQYFAWLTNLRVKRNSIAHKANQTTIEPLELARWLAIVEAILGSMESHSVDDRIGCLVSPVGEKAKLKFSKGSRGVVLRREEYRDMPDYHILMETGETWRMNLSSFKVEKKQDIK